MGVNMCPKKLSCIWTNVRYPKLMGNRLLHYSDIFTGGVLLYLKVINSNELMGKTVLLQGILSDKSIHSGFKSSKKKVY
jgi:hypothetical protein